LDRALADQEYVAGADYSIADMAIWPWYGGVVQNVVYEAAEFLSVEEYPNVLRWADLIGGRPAVQRGRRVNKAFGPEEEQVRERHSADDFNMS
jgi:GST-like protein